MVLMVYMVDRVFCGRKRRKSGGLWQLARLDRGGFWCFVCEDGVLALFRVGIRVVRCGDGMVGGREFGLEGFVSLYARVCIGV